AAAGLGAAAALALACCCWVLGVVGFGAWALGAACWGRLEPDEASRRPPLAADEAVAAVAPVVLAQLADFLVACCCPAFLVALLAPLDLPPPSAGKCESSMMAGAEPLSPLPPDLAAGVSGAPQKSSSTTG